MLFSYLIDKNTNKIGFIDFKVVSKLLSLACETSVRGPADQDHLTFCM